jgi:uncharacterized protein (TIGR00297 family)
MAMQWLTGILIAVVVSLGGWKARALSTRGALAAVLLGVLVFGGGGLAWAFVMVLFFVSSSLLSRLNFGAAGRKAQSAGEFSKGSRRDAWQVAANGGAAGLAVLLHLLYPDAGWPWLAFCATLAAANADTWATELGVFSRRLPVMITTLQPAERGASGAVSAAGTLASLAGAALIGAAGALLWGGRLALDIPPSQRVVGLAIITLAGLGGSLFDSLLGATLQAIYHCPNCDRLTERHPHHHCGAGTQQIRGLPWLDNDRVNLAATLFAPLLALVLGLIFM